MTALTATLNRPLSQFASRGLLLLAAVPFTLLLNSSHVGMGLRIERDGGALRQICVSGTPYFSRQFPPWVADVRAGRPWDGQWRRAGASEYVYSRDFRTQDANYSDGRLSIVDVFQNPLSLYTTYTWTEDIKFTYAYAGDAAMATAAGKHLQYKVRLPGTVTEASVMPAKGSTVESEGPDAVFSLAADQEQVKLTVTGARLRWGYLLIVAYVVAWVAVEVLRVVGRQLRRRPRKI